MYGSADRNLRNEVKHECELPLPESPIISFIDSGVLINIRRKFRKWMMISPTNLRNQVVFRSTLAIRTEMDRHLHTEYYMIHPFSEFIAFWEILFMVSTLILLYAIPTSHALKNEIIFDITKYIFDIINFINIIIIFNTGYQLIQKIILDRCKVASNYITKGFILDVLCTFDFDKFLRIFFPGEQWPKYTNVLKLICFKRILMYMNHFRDYNQYSVYKCKVYKLAFGIALALIWCWYLVDISKPGIPQDSLTKFHIAVYTMTGYGTIFRDSLMDNFSDITCLTVGYIMQLVLTVQFLQIVRKYNSPASRFFQMTQQVEEFMRYKSLPHALRRRILTYFDSRYQLSYFKEEDIHSMLTPQLIQELLSENYMHLLEKVYIFDCVPVAILGKMLIKMKSEIYLPSDVIIQAGATGDCMYFIASGTVAVYTASGQEICHLSDGANFGEMSLLKEDEKRVNTIVAVDYCELFSLPRNEFHRLLERYPEILKRIEKVAQQRLRKQLLANLEQETDEASEPNLHQPI